LWIHILCFCFRFEIFSRCLLGVEYAYMCSRLLFGPCPSYSSTHKYTQPWFYKPDPKMFLMFHGHLKEDLFPRPLFQSLCHTTMLTTLYPSARAPDKPVPPTRPLYTSPTGGSPPKKVISITLKVYKCRAKALSRLLHSSVQGRTPP